MKRFSFAMLVFLMASTLIITARDGGNPWGFNVNRDWNWQELAARSDHPETRTAITELQSILPISEARFLFRQLTRLEQPSDIRRLSVYERTQQKRGGGFYGIIPDHFLNPDHIPEPRDFDSLVQCALFLSRVRRDNLDIISRPSFHYPVSFSQKPFPDPFPCTAPESMSLTLDFSPVKRLLALMEKRSVTDAKARALAESPAFSDMLAHRKSLGYVPEPLPDSSDLACFILRSTSRHPVDRIWNWLNPWNNFCMADIAQHAGQYRKLITLLETRSQRITGHILGRIAKLVPPGTPFTGRVSFAVNWGIRSWVTANALGTNIVQFKDHYDVMLRTLTHETFHRVQLQVCPLNPARNRTAPPSFEDLTSYPFRTRADRTFYRTISHIFLEGTATFAGGAPDGWPDPETEKAGWELLAASLDAAGSANDDTASEKILNRGLQSNGPFYAIGHAISRELAEQLGEDAFRNIIAGGSVVFFRKYSQLNPTAGGNMDESFSKKLETVLNRLHEEMKTRATDTP